MINILMFYGVWIFCSLIMHGAGVWVPPAWTVPLSSLFTVAFLFGLSCLTHQYQRRIEPALVQNLQQRLVLLAACGLVFIGSSAAVLLFGEKLDLIIALHTANLLFFACVFGHWLTTPLKRPAELVPLCLIMSFVDVYSVFKGPSKELTSSLASHYSSGQIGPPPMVDFILIKLPMPGQAALMPVFGVADWIVIALLSGAAAKFNLNDNLFGRSGAIYVPMGAIGLIVSILAARGLGVYLPALPLITAFFLTVMVFRSPEILRLTRNEFPAMVLSTAVASGLFALILL